MCNPPNEPTHGRTIPNDFAASTSQHRLSWLQIRLEACTASREQARVVQHRYERRGRENNISYKIRVSSYSTRRERVEMHLAESAYLRPVFDHASPSFPSELTKAILKMQMLWTATQGLLTQRATWDSAACPTRSFRPSLLRNPSVARSGGSQKSFTNSQAHAHFRRLGKLRESVLCTAQRVDA